MNCVSLEPSNPALDGRVRYIDSRFLVSWSVGFAVLRLLLKLPSVLPPGRVNSNLMGVTSAMICNVFHI